MKSCSHPRSIEVTSFFNIVLAWNRGVSFGMFSSANEYGPYLLTGLALLIVVALGVWLYKVGDAGYGAGTWFDHWRGVGQCHRSGAIWSRGGLSRFPYDGISLARV